MKFVIVLLAVVATTYAQFAQPQFFQQQATQQQFGVPVAKAPVPFVRHSEIRDDHGQYSLGYETGDGIGVAEQGVLKPNSEGQYVLVKQGTYRYTSPDGTPITLNYVADENGFQPSGSHLPKQVLPENPTN